MFPPKPPSDEKWHKISKDNDVFYGLSTSKGAYVVKSLKGEGGFS
jgi:hypothetical protein